MHLRYVKIFEIFPQTWQLTVKGLLSGNGHSTDPGGLKLDVTSSTHTACVAEWSLRELGVSLSRSIKSFTRQLLLPFFIRPCSRYYEGTKMVKILFLPSKTYSLTYKIRSQLYQRVMGIGRKVRDKELKEEEDPFLLAKGQSCFLNLSQSNPLFSFLEMVLFKSFVPDPKELKQININSIKWPA